MGKSVQDMHERLLKIVVAESSSHKKSNVYESRLTRKLAEFPSYVNPLAILSIEIYKLDILQLQMEDVLMHTSTNLNVLNRNYKPLLCGKKKGDHAVFISAFISAFVKQFC
jgi:hypothetical protein